MRILGIESCHGVACFYEIFTARLCGFSEELPVFFVCPQCEQLIEMRKMVRRIAERASRNEEEQVIFPIPHRGAGPSVLAFMQACAQDRSRLFAVIEDALAVAPSVGGEKQ